MTADLEDYSTDEEDDTQGKKTKSGKKKQSKAYKAKMKRYKTTTAYVSKFLLLAAAILLIAVSALRFTVVDMQNTHEAIMNFYFLFFGVILAMQQSGMRYVKRNFRFLNYYWGKALFCVFVAQASLSN
jgi:hypothetical protein